MPRSPLPSILSPQSPTLPLGTARDCFPTLLVVVGATGHPSHHDASCPYTATDTELRLKETLSEPLRSEYLSLLTMVFLTIDRLPAVDLMTQQLSARPQPKLAKGTLSIRLGPPNPEFLGSTPI